ncbi:MAG: hypothetical protein AVDCRST_MAG86-572 [uncultured Truepera sp.]|uniref:Uncharacterized protein n=1 Tax=uncultured Truepera sp. TaxID=543023 RepID=A0A6J4UYI2_9DEIN|nr:MAG: hypothetical protein AVDCRST_MAG86-572 [uncultured Truepera sp.]
MAILEQARQFFLKDARLLERHLFHYHFEGGPRGAVLRALLAYQSGSGVFAYGLEPDKRSAHPQPIDQEQALRVLADIGPDDVVLAQVLDFLPTLTTLKGGLPFVLESVADAPRAPWWNTEPDPPAALNPTASIVGLLYKLGVTHPWLEAATAFVWEKLEALTDSDPHTLLSVLVFLEAVPERAQVETVLERLAEEILRHTALETGAEGYAHPPYAFAPYPESLATRLYPTELMQRHHEVLTKKQQVDGGWPISWPAVGPGSELEYRGIVTLNALKTLRAYGTL